LENEKHEFANLIKEKNLLEKSCELYIGDKKLLEDSIQSIAQMVGSHLAQFDDKSLSNLVDNISNVSTSLDASQRMIKEKDEELSSLKSKLIEKESLQEKPLEKTRLELQHKLDKLSQRELFLVEQLQTAEEQVLSLSAEKSHLLSELERSSNMIEEKETALKKSVEENRTSREFMKVKEIVFEKDLEKTRTQLESRLENVTQRESFLAQKVQSAEDQISRLSKENIQLQSRLEKALTANKDTESTLVNLKILNDRNKVHLCR
jgi:chromosome segregation ATPase